MAPCGVHHDLFLLLCGGRDSVPTSRLVSDYVLWHSTWTSGHAPRSPQPVRVDYASRGWRSTRGPPPPTPGHTRPLQRRRPTEAVRGTGHRPRHGQQHPGVTGRGRARSSPSTSSGVTAPRAVGAPSRGGRPLEALTRGTPRRGHGAVARGGCADRGAGARGGGTVAARGGRQRGRRGYGRAPWAGEASDDAERTAPVTGVGGPTGHRTVARRCRPVRRRRPTSAGEAAPLAGP